jgi:DNA (cytosine-5)-methyltransferase 1
MMDDRPLALDLCSGAGGLTIGLEAAGWRTIGFDNWQPAIDTHRANGLECHRSDLMTVGDAVWQSFAGRVDIVAGGPPCQPFSAAGLGKGKWDHRDAIPGFIRAVKLVQQRMFIMENVRGLTFAKHADYLAAVLQGFRDAGYEVEHRVLNSADYGVPQTRQRLFVIGRNDGLPIVWPEPTHAKVPTGDLLPWVTMAQALGWGDGLVGFPRKADGTGETVERRNDQTGTDEVDRDWPLGRPATTVATRDLVPDPGANANRFNGKAKSRNDGFRVEPEEAATLQGFPRGFVFTGNRTTVFKQIGNACPPAFSYAIATANGHPAEAFAEVSA